MHFVGRAVRALGQERGKMLAIEAPEGAGTIQDKGIAPGKGKFGSIARGPLGQDRGKMLAIEPLACCKRFFFLNSGVACLLSFGAPGGR